MRIIAGEHKGRRLVAPKGRGTRPTTDRVRESLMSALVSACGGLEGAVVLDAFAGSGALALEVMSRGGALACLCECDRGALKAIEENVRALGYGRDQVRVCRTDVLKSGAPRLREPYSLVLLDPPYALEAREVLGVVGRLATAGALAPGAVVSYEHGAASNAAVEEAAAASGLSLASRRAYGDTVIDLLEREGE
ncbi:16S rRNA (guanine(966)-N(2))-methyltransferase RsmD [Adlercreutzia sp. ZJ242]|uniref:16S rRNA (guanine(966)-N(2))-methyltransferase RsmD n=1 Tax=Adlercreutzia sp. ZJ242 TaxID=2709409 RepID=UPI0013EC172D|nr:16S rRNA (guanine(966)-N(2))-methyltransferase RsmD [Adlercreutzia sp. ZJ242]